MLHGSFLCSLQLVDAGKLKDFTISLNKYVLQYTHIYFTALERVSENIHISANEPSLAVYRLQEHVRRALPPTVTRRTHVTALHSQLQGACYDVEYALG